jgi:hypothetical protein
MDAINFKGCNIVYGKDQPEYIPLPANYDKNTGFAITQWKLTDEEVAEIVRNKRLFIGISTLGKPMQPILPSVLAMFHPGEEPELPAEVERPTFGQGDNVVDKEMEICTDCPNKELCVETGCIKKG